ncbi:MAG: ROK family protein [Lachnospiraceae bacterium]|nr:ROK family protein [Lachnospiraceae bacterium]
MNRYVSVDIGGTAIKYGVIREDGEILRKNVMNTEAQKGGPAILSKVQKIVEECCVKEEICGICISTAGVVDVKTGTVTHSAPLIPDYAGTEYKKTLEHRFQISCEVENDVNCAGLAEYYSGASSGSRVALMLTVGTGIGGSIVIDGEIFRGISGSACEVGYMNLPGGEFQSLGAASALIKKVAAWKKEPKELWNGYRIFEAAKGGDQLCRRAVEEMTDVLGLGIANICYVLNPEVVVLGGGIMAQKTYLKEGIEQAVAKYLIPQIACRTRLAFAKHGNDAGMLGAFYHFKHCRAQNESV